MATRLTSPLPESTAEDFRMPRWLRYSLVIGLVLSCLGLGVAINSFQVSHETSWLQLVSGMACVAVGLMLSVTAIRLRGRPIQQAYQPRSIVFPRRWFVILWGIGSTIAFARLFSSATLTETLVLFIGGLLLFTAGGTWCFRWISNKIVEEWPQIDRYAPQASIDWMPSWYVTLAACWGVLSITLGFVVELGILDVLAQAIEILAGVRNYIDILVAGVYERNDQLILWGLIIAVVVAPVVEELTKASGLRLLRRTLRRPIDGWLAGFAIGLACGVLEGAFYLDSRYAWFFMAWLRLGAILMHGLATAITGLFYARSLQTGRRDLIRKGLGRAILLHSVWNFCAFGMMGLVLSAVEWNEVLFGLSVLSIAGLLALIAYVFPRTVKAAAQSCGQDFYVQTSTPLPDGWWPMKFNLGWWLIGSRPISPPRPVKSVVTEGREAVVSE